MFRVVLEGDAGVRAEFEAAAGRALARAAAAAGIVLTTGCLQGRCAICRARLISGSVTAVRRPSVNAVGNPAERADGCVLLCSVAATSNVVVAPLGPWNHRCRC